MNTVGPPLTRASGACTTGTIHGPNGPDPSEPPRRKHHPRPLHAGSPESQIPRDHGTGVHALVDYTTLMRRVYVICVNSLTRVPKTKSRPDRTPNSQSSVTPPVLSAGSEEGGGRVRPGTTGTRLVGVLGSVAGIGHPGDGVESPGSTYRPTSRASRPLS